MYRGFLALATLGRRFCIRPGLVLTWAGEEHCRASAKCSLNTPLPQHKKGGSHWWIDSRFAGG